MTHGPRAKENVVSEWWMVGNRPTQLPAVGRRFGGAELERAFRPVGPDGGKGLSLLFALGEATDILARR